MADRWFVVPRIGAGTENDPYRPKYGAATEIVKWTGNSHDFSDSKWSDLPWHPEVMYIVRFYASKSKPLNDVEKQDDAWSENDASEQEIADYLNDKFDRSLTYDEWQQRFYAGGL